MGTMTHKTKFHSVTAVTCSCGWEAQAPDRGKAGVMALWHVHGRDGRGRAPAAAKEAKHEQAAAMPTIGLFLTGPDTEPVLLQTATQFFIVPLILCDEENLVIRNLTLSDLGYPDGQ